MDKLQLKNLTKKFGDLVVVDGLNLTLRSGEFVSLLGPSGCGKTTTLRLIAGLVQPEGGRPVSSCVPAPVAVPSKRALHAPGTTARDVPGSQRAERVT